MICEPYLTLPQLIDLDLIKKSEGIAKDVYGKLVDSTTFKPKVMYEKKVYDIIPLFQNQFDHLNDILSLHSNDYLACRWNSFLDNATENFINIRLYVDYKKSLETPIVRRKLLNGHFYMNNKIAPVPQISDPRHFGTKHLSAKNST